MPALTRRALSILSSLVVAYAVLIATHGGEFWPFSSFSMFARAGRPWQRALVRAIDDASPSAGFAPSYPLARLPGAALALAPLGIPQNDLSSLVQRAEAWSDADREALVNLFGAVPCRAPLLVLRVSGSIEDGALRQRALPLAVLSCVGGRARLEPIQRSDPAEAT